MCLSSCATTGTILTADVDSVTKTLLISQTFGRFQNAVAVSTDQFANTYVVDRGAPAVIKYGPTGDSLGVISGFGRDQYQFDWPNDVDARLGNSIIIADMGNDRVEKYTKDFAYVASVQQIQRATPPFFEAPIEVASESNGGFYVIDPTNRNVIRVRQDLILDPDFSSTASPARELLQPRHIAVDADDNLLVYDGMLHALYAFDNLGSIKRRRNLEGLVDDESVRSIAARSDTLFVLSSSTGRTPRNRLYLFHTANLNRLGIWELPTMLDETRNVRFVDLDVRNGVTLLAEDFVLRANVSMTIEPK